jgi:uncharacterized protein YciI
MHYLLFYEKGPGYADRQGAFTAAHRAHLWASVRRGELLLGGSLADPVDGSAVLLFRADSPSAVEVFAAADPYVLNGVVSRWWVRAWATVVGEGATTPSPDPDGGPG